MALPPALPRDPDDLICRHLALVRRAVVRLGSRVPSHIDRDDLLAAGHLGLVQAALAYDPRRGVPFDRYALRRVTGAIQDELRALDTSSRRGRAAMRRLDHATEVLAMRHGRLPSTREVARWLGEDAAGVDRARAESARITARRRPQPLDDTTVLLPAPTPGPEGTVLDAERRQDLADAIGALPPRLALIVVAHVLDGREVKSIAAECGVTPSRVSQLCTEALALLRLAMEEVGDVPATAGPVRATTHHRRVRYLASLRAARRRRRADEPPLGIAS